MIKVDNLQFSRENIDIRNLVEKYAVGSSIDIKFDSGATGGTRIYTFSAETLFKFLEEYEKNLSLKVKE